MPSPLRQSMLLIELSVWTRLPAKPERILVSVKMTFIAHSRSRIKEATHCDITIIGPYVLLLLSAHLSVWPSVCKIFVGRRKSKFVCRLRSCVTYNCISFVLKKEEFSIQKLEENNINIMFVKTNLRYLL